MTTPTTTPSTFKFEWMNGGQPFDLSGTRITPSAYRASKVAKRHTFLEACKDIPATMAPEARAALVEEAREEAVQHQGAVLIHGALVQVDPKVKEMTVEQVMDRLDMARDFLALSKAVTSGLRTEKAGSPKGA